MPYIIIYRDIYGKTQCVIQESVNSVLIAVKDYIRSVNIYDEDLQKDINECKTIFDLQELIERYDLDEIQILKPQGWNMEKLN